MQRRVSLPGANELFRPTTVRTTEEDGHAQQGRGRPAPEETDDRRTGSGRVRHDEKITVYVSTDELLALETARLTLRSRGITADRGRIVRASIAMALSDLDEHGDDSTLVGLLTSD